MAQPPTVYKLSNDDQTSRQAPNATIRKLIVIDQDFAKYLALEAVREIEKLWPDLVAERFASQDIIDLSAALRAGNVLLDSRMLRPFLVLWKDKIGNRRSMSSQQFIDLAAYVHGLVSRQLGPVEEQGSFHGVVAADAPSASKVDNVPYRSNTGGYYLDHFEGKWPSTLFGIFNWKQGYVCGNDYQEGLQELQCLWPDLEEIYIPTVEQLKLMAKEIRAARLDLEFRLLRTFVVCWMLEPPNPDGFVPYGHRAKRIRKEALAQMGPKNLVTHDDGSITVLRKAGEENYNPEEDSALEEEEQDRAIRHKLVREVLYPRHRPAPGPSKECAVQQPPTKRKRERSSSRT